MQKSCWLNVKVFHDYNLAKVSTIYIKNLIPILPVKVRAFDAAVPHFEQAEGYAIECNNKGILQMVREAQQCIKLYIDKEDAAPRVVEETDEEDDDHNNRHSL